MEAFNLYDLPSGEAICPYHFEWTDEEWLIVVAGRPDATHYMLRRSEQLDYWDRER